MATRSQKTQVGIFLIACLLLIVGGATYISGQIREGGVSYWIKFDESIQGLYEGTIVSYLGVTIGKVTSITVLPISNEPKVEIAIDPERVTLYNGVEAQLVIYSLAAGTMSIALEGGDPDFGKLPPNSEIPTKKSLLGGISNQVDGIMTQFSTIAEAISTGLEGIEEGSLTAMLENADGLVTDARTFLEDGRGILSETEETIRVLRADAQEVIDEVLALSDEAKPLIRNLDKLADTSNTKIAELDVSTMNDTLSTALDRFSELAESLNSTVKNLDTLTADALHEADNLEYSLRTALGEMGEALYTMRRFVDQLSQDPASLVRGRGTVKEIE